MLTVMSSRALESTGGIIIFLESGGCVHYRMQLSDALKPFAAACGVAQALWWPESLGIRTPSDLMPYLWQGLAYSLMCAHLVRQRASPDFRGFATFLRECYLACQAWPGSILTTTREDMPYD